MTLSERLNRTEATCQGCHRCQLGGTVPCPSQTADWYRPRPEWRRRMDERLAKNGRVAEKALDR